MYINCIWLTDDNAELFREKQREYEKRLGITYDFSGLKSLTGSSDYVLYKYK